MDMRAGEEPPSPPREGPEDTQRARRAAGLGEGLNAPGAKGTELTSREHMVLLALGEGGMS